MRSVFRLSRLPRRLEERRSRADIRRNHVLRSIILAVLTVGIGLVTLSFLSPAPNAIRTIVLSPVAKMVAKPAPAGAAFGGGNLAPTRVVGQSTALPSATARRATDASPVASVFENTPDASTPPVPRPTAFPNQSRFAILLMGYGGPGHDGAYLTDTMMLVIVNPKAKSLALVSFPRDEWVPMSFDGRTTEYNKINTAFAFAKDPSGHPDRLARYAGDKGAGTLAADTISRLTGIPVAYYVGLDFEGFRQAIDAVGGIDVNVPASFAARYPTNDNSSLDASWTVVRFTPGPEHMNGERAIEFARAREAIENYAEGSDFARARRQRLIVEAFKKRLFEPGGFIHLPQLIGIASGHVNTNYPIPALTKLSDVILGWNQVMFYQTAITTNNYLEEATGPDGTYILIPSTDDHSWSQVRAFVQRLWSNPATAMAMASDTIIVSNNTGVPGVAGQVSAALVKLGYMVGPPLTVNLITTSRIVDQTKGGGETLRTALEKDLGISLTAVTGDPNPDQAQLTLEIGTADAGLATSLLVPNDNGAPVSTIGVQVFGSWSQNGPPPPVERATVAPIIEPFAPTPARIATTIPPTVSPVRLSPSTSSVTPLMRQHLSFR